MEQQRRVVALLSVWGEGGLGGGLDQLWLMEGTVRRGVCSWMGMSGCWKHTTGHHWGRHRGRCRPQPGTHTMLSVRSRWSLSAVGGCGGHLPSARPREGSGPGPSCLPTPARPACGAPSTLCPRVGCADQSSAKANSGLQLTRLHFVTLGRIPVQPVLRFSPRHGAAVM